MIKNLFKILVIIMIFICFFGCKTAPVPVEEPPVEFITLPNIVYPTIMYYGADLGYFPPNVRDWIINTQFPKTIMELPYMMDSSLKAWWSDDNDTVLMEASYIVAPCFIDAGTTRTWGHNASYSGSPDLFRIYGKNAHYRTLRFKYDYSLYVDNLLKTDSAFAEIINFAKQLSAEIEFDWAAYLVNRNPVKKTHGARQALSDGYANEVMEKALQLHSVKAVQKWTSSSVSQSSSVIQGSTAAQNSHAWNVLKLADGRTLYFDLSWFDNEQIDLKTGVIYQTDDYDWANITFYEHLFRFSNIGYGTNIFHHNTGTLDSELTK